MFANQWLANELRDLGNYTGAATSYQAAIHAKADYSAAHCQLALIFAREGHLVKAVREYAAAIVPAKVQELNDSECLVIVDHVLNQAVASRAPGTEREAISALNKIEQRRNSKVLPQKAQDAPPAIARIPLTEHAALQQVSDALAVPER